MVDHKQYEHDVMLVRSGAYSDGYSDFITFGARHSPDPETYMEKHALAAYNLGYAYAQFVKLDMSQKARWEMQRGSSSLDTDIRRK